MGVESGSEGSGSVFHGVVGDDGQLLLLQCLHGERLLAQHVLARLERSQRPFPMQVVRERVVDGIDAWVGQQSLVRFRDDRVAVGGEHGASTLWVSARHGHEPAVARGADRGQNGAPGDIGRPQYAPTDAAGYISTLSCAPPREIDSVAASMTATVRRASSAVTASGSPQARWSARLR